MKYRCGNHAQCEGKSCPHHGEHGFITGCNAKCNNSDGKGYRGTCEPIGETESMKRRIGNLFDQHDLVVLKSHVATPERGIPQIFSVVCVVVYFGDTITVKYLCRSLGNKSWSNISTQQSLDVATFNDGTIPLEESALTAYVPSKVEAGDE